MSRFASLPCAAFTTTIVPARPARTGVDGHRDERPSGPSSTGTRLRLLALLWAAMACAPAAVPAQTRSMFSNLANPAIGLNALFSGQAAPTLSEPYGLHFDEAEVSFISVVDPYWTLESNIVFLGDGTVDPEEVWVRNT